MRHQIIILMARKIERRPASQLSGARIRCDLNRALKLLNSQKSQGSERINRESNKVLQNK